MKTQLPTGRTARAAAAAVLLCGISAAPLAAQSPVPGLGVDTTAFDRSVRPQDDFYQFVNGGWIKGYELPADRTSYGSFVMLRDKSDDAIKAIVDELVAAKDVAPGTNRAKIRDLYLSYMDSAAIEKAGITPLRPHLARIAALRNRSELPALFAEMARIGVQIPFAYSVGQDAKNSERYAVYIGQGGLGMPDRDYYLKQDARFDTIRQKYSAYVERVLSLSGVRNARAEAARIVELETKLATAHWDRARNRDRNATYNPMTIAGLSAMAPGFDWAAYGAAAGLGAADDAIVRQPDAVKATAELIAATPVKVWKSYLTYKLVASFAPLMSSPFASTIFDFNGRTLSGQQVPRPRWKRGVDLAQGSLGEAIGELYVARNFRPEAKLRMQQLVANLVEAYRQGIDQLEWMSPATRLQAQAKLSKFTVKIGYPDKWRDYSALEIRAGDPVGNAMRSATFGYNRMIARYGKPVDRTEWGMTPQTVNAYYSSSNNEIVFPAAILQPPFFNVEADDAVNYGGIGAVIGHEISHGFDDQGRKSDGDGNLRDWWTAEDAKAFEARANALAEQYGEYSPVPGMNVNGRLTLGENIGDLSGMAVAYRAYKLSLQGKEAPVIGGFSGDQRFFLGWAQVWRTTARQEALRQQILTDPHSPGMYRANGPLVNFEPFYAAWGLKQGDGMYREPGQRIRIW